MSDSMILLFLDKYYITNSEEALTFYGILKDFIVPSITLILTVLGSIIVFNYSFKKEKSHNQFLEIKEDKVTTKIIRLTNNTITKEIAEAIKIVEKNTTNLSFKNFSEFYQTKFNKKLNHFLLEIGLKRIYTLHVIENKIEENSFVKYWNSIHQLPGYLSIIETYDQYITNEYNRLNRDLNEKLHEILVTTSNYIHDHIPPFETIKLDIENLNSNPSLKLATILVNFYEDFHKLGPDLAMLEKTEKFLLNLNTIKKHPIASKAINSSYAQEIIYAINILENFKALFNAGKDSYKNYLDALAKAKTDIENYQMELDKET